MGSRQQAGDLKPDHRSLERHKSISAKSPLSGSFISQKPRASEPADMESALMCVDNKASIKSDYKCAWAALAEWGFGCGLVCDQVVGA